MYRLECVYRIEARPPGGEPNILVRVWGMNIGVLSSGERKGGSDREGGSLCKCSTQHV